MRNVLIVLLLTVFISNMSFAENVTVEKLIKSVKQNIDSIHDLKSTLEITRIVNGRELKQNKEVIYKKPNKFKMVSLSSTGVSLLEIASDGAGVYNKSKLLYYDEEIRKQKYDKVKDYPIFRNIYNIGYDYIFEKVLKENNQNIINEGSFIYKIEVNTNKSGEINEIWIDYEKGLIVKYKICHFEELTFELKEYKKFDKVYFPIKTISGNKTKSYNVIKEAIWKNIKINEGINENNLKINKQK